MTWHCVLSFDSVYEKNRVHVSDVETIEHEKVTLYGFFVKQMYTSRSEKLLKNKHAVVPSVLQKEKRREEVFEKKLLRCDGDYFELEILKSFAGT